MARIYFCNFLLCLLIKCSIAEKIDCPSPADCNENDDYRRMDGQCNNIAHPLYGSANRAFRRLLPPVYDDGVGTPRGSNGSLNLPNSRKVSRGMSLSTESTNSELLSLMAMSLGQFLAHDITKTPHTTDEIECCTPDFKMLPKAELHPECIPVDVFGDEFYSRSEVNVECLTLGRSKIAGAQCGTSTTREQINVHTAWIDLSHVYGNSEEDNLNLRTGLKGQLKVDEKVEEPPGEQCPVSPKKCPFTQLPLSTINGKGSILSADPSRVDENPGLVSLHALFIRFHNDVAEEFSTQYSNDEVIFQEARRIVIAVFQHIVYNEYLPTLLDHETIEAHDLSPSVPHSYDAAIDATAPNVFSTGAFRVGHTQIQNVFLLKMRSITLRHSYHIPNITYQTGQHPSEFCHGISSEVGNEFDHFVVEAATNYLYAKPPFKSGSDLFLRNTERGRDHGLQSYNEWRKYCGLRAFSDFADLRSSNEMHPEAVDVFERLYQNVNHLDLYPSGLAEKPKNVVGVGPTFQHIIAQHFRNLKFGDRFFYTSTTQPKPFTAEELTNIKGITLSTLICRYTTAESVNEHALYVRNIPSVLSPIPLVPTDNNLKICTNLALGYLESLLYFVYHHIFG